MGLFPSRSTKPFEIPKEIKTKENNKKIKSLFVVFSLNNDWKLNWRAPFFLYKKRRERCWRFSHSSLSKSSEFRHKMGNKKKEKVGKGGNGSVGFFIKEISTPVGRVSRQRQPHSFQRRPLFFPSFLSSLSKQTHTHKHTFQSLCLKLHPESQVSDSCCCFPSKKRDAIEKGNASAVLFSCLCHRPNQTYK